MASSLKGRLAPRLDPLELLTVKEAAAYAKISTQTVRRWLKDEALKSYRAGRQIRIDRNDLEVFIGASPRPW